MQFCECIKLPTQFPEGQRYDFFNSETDTDGTKTRQKLFEIYELGSYIHLTAMILFCSSFSFTCLDFFILGTLVERKCYDEDIVRGGIGWCNTLKESVNQKDVWRHA